MFTTIIEKAVAVIMAIAISIGGILGFYQEPQSDSLGAVVPVTVALFETSLASKITSSATSMTLVSGTDKSGDALSGYVCFVIDEGSASEEFVCGTASSTAISSMIRGIDPIDGDLEVTALQESHRRGASVKVSNYPQLAIISRIINGDETFPNELEYASHPTFTENTHIIDKKYADDLSFSGTADALFSTKGLVELATTSELIAGTATGSSAAYLAIPNLFCNTTSSATNLVPITGTDGKLSQGFLDLTENYSWSGNATFTGETTFSGTTTLDIIQYNQVYTANATFTVPTGVKYFTVEVVGGGGSGGNVAAAGGTTGGGGGGGYAREILDLSGTSTVVVVVGNPTNFGSYLSATGGSNGSGADGGAGGIGSGGDINIKGGGGTPPVDILGGTGGSSVLGGGGKGGRSNANGEAGGVYGGGGGGCDSSSNDCDGGAGAGGVVIISWYKTN